ncbi:hypothetical protein NM208_g2565 [Fusarium decemcellulare]|uniref:Uncharacterized protein n=1 Tax=Fusarium decemcellulare TaxID=57161 RepID=A0ACC1SSN8_9HYPO|nr:hypothetical protein NM208_g2565 [Fusarium decemcellulare]
MIDVGYLAFWNLGIFALAICVLSGCRTSMERNYSIVNWPRETVGLIWGDECMNATADFIPDVYKLGASGMCRVVDGKTSCKSKFPPSLNLAKFILEDLEEANSTESSEVSAVLQDCREAIDKPIKHSTAEKLGIAMISFLIVSIFLNIISVAVAAAAGAFGIPTTCILIVDALFIFTALILCIAMMNYEGGGYLKNVSGKDFSDREMIGIAIWMLLGMLIARALSNPFLFVGALAIILPIVLVYVLFLVRTRGFFAVPAEQDTRGSRLPQAFSSSFNAQELATPQKDLREDIAASSKLEYFGTTKTRDPSPVLSALDSEQSTPFSESHRTVWALGPRDPFRGVLDFLLAIEVSPSVRSGTYCLPAFGVNVLATVGAHNRCDVFGAHDGGIASHDAQLLKVFLEGCVVGLVTVLFARRIATTFD